MKKDTFDTRRSSVIYFTPPVYLSKSEIPYHQIPMSSSRSDTEILTDIVILMLYIYMFFQQDYSLTSQGRTPFIDFDTTLFWSNIFILLKNRFPTLNRRVSSVHCIITYHPLISGVRLYKYKGKTFKDRVWEINMKVLIFKKWLYILIYFLNEIMFLWPMISSSFIRKFFFFDTYWFFW